MLDRTTSFHGNTHAIRAGTQSRLTFHMNSAVEIAVAVFAISNSIRVLAYIPQIVRGARDRDGAAAVSCLTWFLFAVSHFSTVAYAIIVIEDWRMAAIFCINMLACLIIIGLTIYKRCRISCPADVRPAASPDGLG